MFETTVLVLTFVVLFSQFGTSWANSVELIETFQCTDRVNKADAISRSENYPGYFTFSTISCALLCQLKAFECGGFKFDTSTNECTLNSLEVPDIGQVTVNLYCRRLKMISSTSTGMSTTVGMHSSQFTTSSTIAEMPSLSDTTSTLASTDSSNTGASPSTMNLESTQISSPTTSSSPITFTASIMASTAVSISARTTASTGSSITSQTSVTSLSTSWATTKSNATSSTTSTLSITICSGTGVIGVTSYPNLSCYPRKLFNDSSYEPKPCIGETDYDCQCKGGYTIQDDMYVAENATNFRACFEACYLATCEAFTFMEKNSTCVIFPTYRRW